MEVDLNKYHSILLKTMEVFHFFCEKNGLTYSISGGTMLGAVRHGGFIPWDDDIDVMMPRPDYNRFLEITANAFVDGYTVISQYNTKNYRMPFAKIMDLNSTVIPLKENKDCPYGAFIDIFPIDGITEKEYFSKKNVKKYFRTMAYALSLHNGPNYNKLQSIIIHLIARLSFKNSQQFLIECDSIAQKYGYDSCPYLGQYFSVYSYYKEMYPRDVFDETEIIDFEGIKVRCIKQRDKYLTIMYGDYMTPPPPEKRVTHHFIYYINLDRRLSAEEIDSLE